MVNDTRWNYQTKSSEMSLKGHVLKYLGDDWVLTEGLKPIQVTIKCERHNTNRKRRKKVLRFHLKIEP